MSTYYGRFFMIFGLLRYTHHVRCCVGVRLGTTRHTGAKRPVPRRPARAAGCARPGPYPAVLPAPARRPRGAAGPPTCPRTVRSGRNGHGRHRSRVAERRPAGGVAAGSPDQPFRASLPARHNGVLLEPCAEITGENTTHNDTSSKHA